MRNSSGHLIISFLLRRSKMLSCYAGCSLYACVIQVGLYNSYTYGEPPALH